MQLSPDTKLGKLISAIPSSVRVCSGFQIVTEGNADKTLGELCIERGIPFHKFLEDLNNLDWDEEFQQD